MLRLMIWQAVILGAGAGPAVLGQSLSQARGAIQRIA